MSYEDDYRKAKADGTLKDPIPAGSISARRIASQTGVDIATLLDDGPGVMSVFAKAAGITWFYDSNFESWCSAEDAVKARKYIRKQEEFAS